MTADAIWRLQNARNRMVAGAGPHWGRAYIVPPDPYLVRTGFTPPPLVSAALKLLVPTQVLIHMELLSTAGGTVQRQILRYWTQNWCQYNNISILKFCCVSSAFKLSQTTKTILQEP